MNVMASYWLITVISVDKSKTFAVEIAVLQRGLYLTVKYCRMLKYSPHLLRRVLPYENWPPTSNIKDLVIESDYYVNFVITAVRCPF